MAGEWKRTSLRDAGVKLIDCDHRTPPAADGGYPYVAIPQLKEGRLALSDVRRISPEHFAEWTRKAKPQHHDVILSRRCNPGETAYVPAGIECALGQNLVLLRADGTNLFPAFLRWLVRGPDWWEQVGSFINVGAVFDSLKCADIPNFKMRLPPLPEQKAIAAVLGALDDKIELNRRMNATLEAMARALFQSWFVDFDPVRAKLDGRKPIGLDEPTVALFPDSFDETELGHIPHGWTSGNFGIVTSPARERIGDSEAVVLSAVSSSQLVRSDEHFNKQVYSKSISNYLKVRHWDFAYNPSRINIGSIGMLKENIVGAVSPVYEVFRTTGSYHWFIERALAQPDTKTWIQTLCSGSVRQSLKLSDLESIPLVIPPPPIVKAFNKAWGQWHDLIQVNENESRTLATLRDTLLPKLLSGELKIKDAT